MRSVLDRWIATKEINGIWRKSTANRMKLWAKTFYRFMLENCHINSLDAITKDHMDLYRHKVLSTMAKNTQANERDRLLSLFNWSLSEGIILSSPIAHWQPIKTPKVPKNILSCKQIETILTSINTDTLGGIHDRALVETLYATAIRRNELISLDTIDLDLKASKLHIREGKGGKSRMLPITKSALFWLKLYLRDARKQLVRDPKCLSLFVGKAGDRLTTSHLARLMKKLREKTGIGHLTPHLLRHSCATHLMDTGVPLPYVKEFLGHTKLSTTQKYLHVSISALKDKFDTAHPRENWSIQPAKKRNSSCDFSF